MEKGKPEMLKTPALKLYRTTGTAGTVGRAQTGFLKSVPVEHGNTKK